MQFALCIYAKLYEWELKHMKNVFWRRKSMKHAYLFTSHFDHTPSCTIYIRIIYVCARNFVTGFSLCCAHCQRQTDRCVLCASVRHCTSFIHVGRIGFISTKNVRNLMILSLFQGKYYIKIDYDPKRLIRSTWYLIQINYGWTVSKRTKIKTNQIELKIS